MSEFGHGVPAQSNHDDRVETSTLDDDSTPVEEYSNITVAHQDEGFDPHHYGNRKNAISFRSAVIHTFIAAASPTLMNIPFTFDQVGYVLGFVGSLVVVLFYANCMHTLLAVEYTLCKRLRRPNLTYAEVIYFAFTNGPRRFRWFAKTARQLVYVDFLCIWGGGNAINVLLASENIRSIYNSSFDGDIGIRQVMLYLSVPLIALCWIPNLKLLAICSAVANVVNISCIAIILSASLTDLSWSMAASRRAIGDIFRVPTFLAVVLITLNSTGVIMPVKNEMKNPASMSSRFGVLNVAYFPISFLYSFFGLLCYVKYGEDVEENIVLNMSNNNFGKIVIGLYATGIIFTYPLMSYVAFDTVWNNMLKDKIQKNNVYSIKKYCCRTLVAALSIAMAFIVPDVSLFVSLTGNVGVSLDSIIFPTLAQLLVQHAEMNGKRRNTAKFCKQITYIFLGVILCIGGSFDTLVTLFRHYT